MNTNNKNWNWVAPITSLFAIIIYSIFYALDINSPHEQRLDLILIILWSICFISQLIYGFIKHKKE